MTLKTQQIYEFGTFRLDAAERLLFQNGEAVPLPPKVVETLIALVENNGRLLEKEDLIKRVWPDTFVEENNLNRHVSMLRKALGEGQAKQKFIETVPKRGYRFVADVKSVGERTELVIERSKMRVRVEEEADRPPDERVIEEPAAAQVQGTLLTAERARQKSSLRGRLTVFVLVIALALATATAAWLIWRKPGRTSRTAGTQTALATTTRTIAVLPFQPISAESRDEILELGMSDALITKLSNLREVVVRPTSAIRKYAGLNQDPLAAGRELQVDAIMVGNVQKAGDTLRVTVQLINVQDGRPLWAEKFDTKFTDIFAVQDTISAKVASALTLHLTGEEQTRIAKRYTRDEEAYQLYLKGRYFLEIDTEESLRKALDYFKQATEKDAGYALAHAGITEAYMVLGRLVVGVSKEELAVARAAAERAIELDDTLAEAHHALGDIEFTFDWNWKEAERQFQRALELNPHDADARQSYGDYLMAAGRLDEGLAESKRSIELDPLSTRNNLNLAVALIGLRRYDEAITQLQKTTEINADYASVQALLGRVYLLKGMYAEAIAQYQKVLSTAGGRQRALIGLAQAYALTGRRDEARKMLDEVMAQQREHHVQFYYIAIVQTALGERDAAFESLKKGVAEHELGMLYLKLEARFDPLRSDPRFTEIMRSVGIPE